MWALDTPGANLMNFHIVTQGECVIRIDDIIYPLSAGDAVFMARDEKHTIATSNCIELPVNQWESKPMTTQIDEPSIGLVCGNITHDHPVFIRLLAQLPKVVIVRQDANSTAANIIKLLLKESKKTDSNTSFLLDRLADAIFIVLVKDNVHIPSGILAAMSHPKLSKPLELIHKQLDQQLSVDALAEHAGMSRSAFASLFKAMLELSPAEYTIQWRMTQAYRWLADEGISTYAAAIKCGYESEASFSKAFKRINGIGLGEARKENSS